MFLARVLVGEYSVGHPMYCRPPSKDTSFTSFYDSCVDDMANPKIYVIFDSNQIYPEYMIEFYWGRNAEGGENREARGLFPVVILECDSSKVPLGKPRNQTVKALCAVCSLQSVFHDRPYRNQQMDPVFGRSLCVCALSFLPSVPFMSLSTRHVWEDPKNMTAGSLASPSVINCTLWFPSAIDLILFVCFCFKKRFYLHIFIPSLVPPPPFPWKVLYLCHSDTQSRRRRFALLRPWPVLKVNI